MPDYFDLVFSQFIGKNMSAESAFINFVELQ